MLISAIWYPKILPFLPQFLTPSQPAAVRKALTDANLEMDEIDGVAFTRGPGPCPASVHLHVF